MSNCVAFHTQIASIMEELANAAVAEICKLVDDGYAVLRLEMSQSQKENESLRRKLQVLEMRLAQACDLGDKTRTKDISVNSRPKKGSVLDKFQGSSTAELDSITAGRSPSNSGLGSDGEPNEDQDDSVLKDSLCSDMEEGSTESVLIKEESLEEDGDTPGVMSNNQEGLSELRNDAGKMAAALSNRTPSSKGRETLTDQQRTRRHVWEVSGPDTVLKSEPGNCGVTQRLQLGAEALSSPDSEFAMFERPGQQGSYCTQEGALTETEDPCCSYASETGPLSLSFHLKLHTVAARDEGSGNHRPMSPSDSDKKTEVMVIGSQAFDLEADGNSDWTKDTMSVSCNIVNRDDRNDGEWRKMVPESSHNALGQSVLRDKVGLSNFDAPERSAILHYDNGVMETQSGAASLQPTGAVRRRFVCKCCWKNFSSQSHLELHLRSHSAEKPFSCAQCGKSFAQSRALRNHLYAHSGERQFFCPQCGKSFFSSRDLKKHQAVHTRQRPFVCALCRKSFVCLSQLKVHQNVHTGARPFSCTACGKSFSHPSNLKRHQRHHAGELTPLQSQTER